MSNGAKRDLVKVQVLSDQHIEFEKNFLFFKNEIVPSADILVIAGDFCPLTNPTRMDVIKTFLLKHWKYILIVPGNHEFYQSNSTDDFLRSKVEVIRDDETGNECYYANNSVVEIEGVNFVCSTLWSQISPSRITMVQMGMNDYSFIDGFTVNQSNDLNLIAREFIQNTLDDLPEDEECVVVTHHLPSFSLISDKWRNHGYNDAFACNLDFLISSYDHKISTWIHGHSHELLDNVVCNIRFVRNTMGYPSERDYSTRDKLMSYTIEV